MSLLSLSLRAHQSDTALCTTPSSERRTESRSRTHVPALSLRGVQCFVAHAEEPTVAIYPSGLVIAANDHFLDLIQRDFHDVLGEMLFECTNLVQEHELDGEGVYSFDDFRVLVIDPHTCLVY